MTSTQRSEWDGSSEQVVLFNFRSDRMVEISKAFEYEEFKAFDRKRFPKVRASFQDVEEGSASYRAAVLRTADGCTSIRASTLQIPSSDTVIHALSSISSNRVTDQGHEQFWLPLRRRASWG